MLFNSLEFLIFFPTVLLIYFAIPHRWRWFLLLAASYFFYMCWKPAYIILIIASTLVDYICGLGMDNSCGRTRRRCFLLGSLVCNLGLLFTFKYLNFFSWTVHWLFAGRDGTTFIPILNVLLPVGISFYTFQTLSYTIDVYRGNRKAERHLGYFALYVSFFPQLVAGPIERSTELLPQLRREVTFDEKQVVRGLRRVLWGLFKKMVVADNAAELVEKIYSSPAGHSGPVLIVGTLLFAYQIYCDFSGYSDIAIGVAQAMGIRLMENFRRPYASRSIGEFWRRWHISLSTWFRDYLYIPLGGNRCRRGRWLANLLIVFLLSGLWHGAGWTFIIWGCLHGLYLIGGIVLAGFRKRSAELLGLCKVKGLVELLSVLMTFGLTCFAWIFFRAQSLSDAMVIVSRLTSGWGGIWDGCILAELGALNAQSGALVVSLVWIPFLEVMQLVFGENMHAHFEARSRPYRWTFYYLIVAVILVFGVFSEQQFIYFQF